MMSSADQVAYDDIDDDGEEEEDGQTKTIRSMMFCGLQVEDDDIDNDTDDHGDDKENEEGHYWAVLSE